MKIIGLIAASVLLSSCMHLGMMMDHGGDPSSSQQPIIEKDVVSGNIRAIVVVPAFELGIETTLRLRLLDEKTGRPLSGAKVSFHAQYLHTPNEHEMQHSEMQPRADSTQRQSMMQNEEATYQELAEHTPSGVFEVSFRPSQVGDYKVMFHITAVGVQRLEPEVNVEVTRTVPGPHDSHGGGMSGLSSASDYAIIGTALMGAMMLLLWATGGRMF
jgi:hypothetical protein